MKAKEYFDKYETVLIDELISVNFEQYGKTPMEELSDNEFVATKNLLKDMVTEMEDICIKRNIVLQASFVSVLKEMNQKWNAISVLFKNKYGYSPLKKDGLKNYWILCFPEFEDSLKR